MGYAFEKNANACGLILARFLYWNYYHRLCAYSLVGIAQTYLAGAAMSGFNNAVIPLLMPAGTALGIHAITRFRSCT